MIFAVAGLVAFAAFVAAFIFHKKLPSLWKKIVFVVGLFCFAFFAVCFALFMSKTFEGVDQLKPILIAIFGSGMIFCIFASIYTRNMDKAFGIFFLSLFLVLGIGVIILGVQLSQNFFVPETRSSSASSTLLFLPPL